MTLTPAQKAECIATAKEMQRAILCAEACHSLSDAEISHLEAQGGVKSVQDRLVAEIGDLRLEKAELREALERCAEHIKASDEDWDLNSYWNRANDILEKTKP